MKFQKIQTRSSDLSWSIIFVPLALLIVLVALKPMPLFGGFADDVKYLIGAQCLDCIPTNHWERRIAITWPTGLAIRLFGQNTWSVMLAPLAAGLAALALTFKLVETEYGRHAGLLATCVLAVTPVFTDRSMRVSIDVIELAFLLGSAFLLQRRKSHFWAGALLALAVLCRPTQLAALPILGLLAWWMGRERFCWFVAGFATPIVIEALAYFFVVGDPLYPWKLSLNHMEMWRTSSASVDFQRYMSGTVNTSESPFFNLQFINGWAPISGIDTHWSVQGFVNLLFNVECGITLSAAIALSILAWKKLDKLQIGMIICAALYFGALTYGFAVDPRPRMFLPIVVIAAALIGSLAPQLWTWPYKIVVVIFVVLIPLTTLVNIINRADFSQAAGAADDLLSKQAFLVTENARQRMALLRQDFPTSGKDLIEIANRCPPRLQDRWLAHREGSLCIYRSFPWPFEPYRNGVEQWGKPTPWRLWPPNRC